jgi:hypothetical protein
MEKFKYNKVNILLYHRWHLWPFGISSALTDLCVVHSPQIFAPMYPRYFELILDAFEAMIHQIFSMGSRSGLLAGQSNVVTSLACKNLLLDALYEWNNCPVGIQNYFQKQVELKVTVLAPEYLYKLKLSIVLPL